MKDVRAAEYDVVIIGAGITGVAISRALAMRQRAWRIAVIEKESAPACHTSGRNSGVLHAGFNPKPGTMKARFCVEGNRRIQELCLKKGVPFKPVGTLVVARSEPECHVLEELYRRGEANGVPHLHILSREQLRQLEPRVKGCAALYAPTGSVVDSRRVVETLAQEARDLGVAFYFGEQVHQIEQIASSYAVYTIHQRFKCAYLINAAGLHADRIAHMLGGGKEYGVLPFRGEYYRVRDRKAQLVNVMVYPVPDLNYPFLGIHFTPTAYGELKVGPNAVLALGREAYDLTHLNLRDTLTMLADVRSWRLIRKPEFRRLMAQQLRTSLTKRTFLREASTLVEGLEEGDLVKGTPAGIRAQMVDRTGGLVDDLVIERQDNVLHILNVVSPGMTCALPFADYVASLS